MANPSKAKGTAAETAVLRYATAHGFAWTERLALSGIHDRGDLSLLPGRAVIVEVKNHAGVASTGQPTAATLTAWMAQTQAEATNAGADHGLLVVKRAGTADPGRWFTYLRADTNAALVGAPDPAALPEPHAPVCMSFASALVLLRHAGYGDALAKVVRPEGLAGATAGPMPGVAS